MHLYEFINSHRKFHDFSLISLGRPEDFGSIAKRGWGGFLALKSHIICSSKKSCMKTKVDIVCFSLNSVFLIDQKKKKKKNDDCAEEKDAHGLLFVFFFCDLVPIFFTSFSPVFLLFPSSFLLLFTMHLLRYAYLI